MVEPNASPAEPQDSGEPSPEPLPVPEDELAPGAEEGSDPYARESAIAQLTAPEDDDT
jgi:hypothetical protein